MQSTLLRVHILVVNPNLNRCICTGNVQYSLTRESRILKKMMVGSRKKKLFYNNGESLLSQPAHLSKNKIVSTHKTRRTEALNKLFMKYITDLMSSGEVAPQLLGRGIDISHVHVSLDFKHLNVYWFSKHDKEDESTESVLRKCGGHLQHELSQLKVIGIVPPIKFVKNKHLSMVKEVEKRLNSLHLGKNVTSSENVIERNEPILFTQLPSDAKLEIRNMDITDNSKEDDEGQDAFEVNLPKMRHDIFSLNHYEIMNKVRTNLKKAHKSIQEKLPLVPQTERPDNFSNIEEHISNTAKRELFAQFLKQRQIQSKQRNKEKNKRLDSPEEISVHFREDQEDYSREEKDEDFEIDESSLQQWK